MQKKITHGTTLQQLISDMIGDSAYDSNYIHTQLSSSASWVVNHNLNKYPSVTVVDSANSVVIGDIQYNSVNQLTITFVGAFSGKAYIN